MNTALPGWWVPSTDSPISHFVPEGQDFTLCGKDLLLKSLQRMRGRPDIGACKSCVKTLGKKPSTLPPRKRLAKILTEAGFRSTEPLAGSSKAGVQYIDVQVRDLRVSRGWQRTQNVWTAELWRLEDSIQEGVQVKRWRWRELTSLDTMTRCAQIGVVFRELGPNSYEVIAISSAETSGIKYQKGVLFYKGN